MSHLSRLRVADASVKPTIPRANINLTAIMIGEHVADWMRDEARAQNTHKSQIWPQGND
jgi:choline dehydrogenase-like flavoprotein